MISKTAIEFFGLDAKSLRPRFEPAPGTTRDPNVDRMIKRWRARAQQGRDMNLKNYKLYQAIDHCWDSGLRQTTQTMMSMLRDLTDSGGKDVDAVAVAKSWDMQHLISIQKDPKTGKDSPVLDFPVMQQVILGLPRSFTMMRVSRILNERLQVPLMKYEAAWTTDINRLRTEVGTQRIEQGNREFGYAATYCECVQAAATYGEQLQFIEEEWYQDTDYVETTDEVGNKTIQGVIGKEGLRYVLPHRSRCSIDMDYPAYTINTDTGCRWANYWRTSTFGSVKEQKYWNTDRITRSDRFGDAKWMHYFQTTGQCRMSAGFENTKFSQIDRERQIDGGTTYYSADQDDQPVWVTHHFERMNPREEFGDPKMPDCHLWFRIVLASDDTPIYVTALPDRPVTYWPYEPVGAKSVQSSMVIELMPYGEHASNIVTQGLISLDQNLANLNFFNKDAGIDQQLMEDTMKNSRHQRFRKLVFVGFSGRQMLKQMTDMSQVFQSYRFPQMDVQNHLIMLQRLLEIMRQVVGMSEQEIGGASSHEQSAEEIKTIHSATSQRAEYVAAWMDFAFEAWKRQLWVYYMTMGSLRAFASLGPEFTKIVQEAGFKIEQQKDSRGRMIVSCGLSDLRVEQFVAQRDGPNRIPWTTVGGQMLSFLQVFMGSQLAQQLQPVQTVKLVNDALESLQFPRNFRIELSEEQISGEVSQATQTYVQQQIAELVKQIKSFVDKEVQAGVKEATPPAPETVLHNPMFIGAQ